MSHWWFVGVVLLAFLWAKMEIEIEGKDGWAAKLPTWRIEKHPLLNIFMGGKPLTGYHFWAFSLVFTMFHLPLFWIGGWEWRGEAHIVGIVFFFWVIEDYLWFVLNPHFGFKAYRKENIWWHKHWMLGFPVDYWVMGLIGALLFSIPLR